MRKINIYVLSLLMLLSLLATYITGLKAHYIVLFVSLLYAARCFIIKPRYIKFNKGIYTIFIYIKIIIVYLIILTTVYLIQSPNAGLSKLRDIFAQLNYMILYLIIFIYAANMIIEKSIASKNIEKMLILYLYIYYIWYNIVYIVQNSSVAHNAYYACLGLILLSNAIDKLLYKKMQNLLRIVYILQIIALILMPIMGYLRGATLSLMVILAVHMLSIVRDKRSNKLISAILMVAILAMSINVLTSKQYIKKFEETNIYGYSRPQDILGAYTSNSESNRDVRITWWSGILATLSSSPIWGTAFMFEFQPFGTYTSNASMLHNYYASIVVDTGSIVIILYVIIVIGAIKAAIKQIKKGKNRIVKYICWNIAIMSTYATNAYGHVWHIAIAMAILHSYALLKMYGYEEKEITWNNTNEGIV